MAAQQAAATQLQQLRFQIQNVQIQAGQLSAALAQAAQAVGVQIQPPVSPPLYPWKFYIGAGILTSANVALWATTGYMVGRLDTIKIWIACISATIGTAVLFLVAFGVGHLVESRNPGTLRYWAGVRLPAVSIIAVESLAILAIAVYLPTDALVRYRNMKWQFGGDIRDSAPVPGFALFGNYNDAVSAKFSMDYSECTFPSWKKDHSTLCSESFSDTPQNWTDSPYGNVTYYTFFNTKGLTFSAAPSSVAPQGQQLLLKTHVVWDSKRIGAPDSYNTKSPQDPSLYSILFDPNMTRDELKLAIDCGFLRWTEQPALGSSTYTIDETITTVDRLEKIASQIANATCKDHAVKLYTKEGGYSTYRYHVTSSGTSFGDACDLKGATDMADVEEACTTQVLIRVGSFFQSTLTSQHGTDAVTILTDIGGILGAISYIGWFLTIFQ